MSFRSHHLVLPCILLCQSSVAHAYIGPGAGISAIGTVIALLGALLLAIIGFIWYPLKRLRRKQLEKKAARTIANNENHPADDTMQTNTRPQENKEQ